MNDPFIPPAYVPLTQSIAHHMHSTNERPSIRYMAYMLKYDTVHGMLPDDITVEGDTLVVNGRRVIVTAYMDPVHTYTQNTLYRS